MTSYLHAYNPQWPQRYQQESELIKQASIIDLQLFHIGSTSVKGLYAKDCIDILGVNVLAVSATPEMLRALETETREQLQQEADQAHLSR